MSFVPHNEIKVRGAREHNLKNVNVDLPRNELIVITGLSGSGKSSLAFDTIYADGQRRYVESLSAYARQFLEMMQKPDVDTIEGLSPAISIEQKTTSRNPRSTVGTVTEIYDYMRLLFARVGIPHSPATGLPIESQTVSQMVDRILQWETGTRFYLLAPIVRARKGEYRKELLDLKKRGFLRVRIDGKIFEIGKTPTLDKKRKHDVDVVVDRLVIREDLGTRLADSLETALQLSDGLVLAEPVDEGETLILSAKFACPVSGFTIAEIEPRLFSFNNPTGACGACSGLGQRYDFSIDLVVPDFDVSLGEGAVAPWSRATTPSPYYRQTLEAVCHKFGGDMNAPFGSLPQELQDAIVYGSDKDIAFVFDDGMRTYRTTKTFEGVIPNLARRYRETESTWSRDELERYQTVRPCRECDGYRLKAEGLAVKINSLHIGQISQMSIRQAHDLFLAMADTLDAKRKQIAERILKEICERLTFLVDVGLEYLTLSRASGSLSGGESQRIRLASQIGSGLTGVLYVLDEPSIGLHQRDNARLLVTLQHLRDLGNTVIVVEHDEEAIRAADYLVDMGPGAGVFGGEVISAGTPKEVFAANAGLTAQYITGMREIPLPAKRRRGNGFFIKLIGANGNNLDNVDVDIPLGTFCVVSGVSGSGKSTLILETLYRAAAKQILRTKAQPAPFSKLLGLEYLDKVIDIDQAPIGRTPRSNPATYTGAFGPIRDWFAALPESKVRGYGPGRFSFNVKGGRCEACQGDGVIKIEMHFLPDVYVPCDQCAGKRYNRETLAVSYRGKTIHDVLDMTIEEAAEFFTAVPAIRDKLVTLCKVGLNYIKTGQSATTLSGGEAQRVKLAKELSRKATGRTLYILDEPTTGLHFEDVRRLLEVLQALVNTGNTVLVIEHNLEVIKSADWVLDMGPDGGDKGGLLIAHGTPEDIAKVEISHTGQYLAPLLQRHAAAKKLAAKVTKNATKAKPVKKAS